MKGFRAELENGGPLEGWTSDALLCSSTSILCSETAITCAALAGVFMTTLEEDDVIVAVREDGVDLDEQEAAEDVETTPSSWHYDPVTRELRVHLTDPGAAIAEISVVAVYLDTVARGDSIVAPRTTGGLPHFWDGRLAGIPSIGQRIPPDELGAGVIASLSELTLMNEDGKYDRLLAQRVVKGYAVRIRYGELSLPFDQLDLWLEAIMDRPRGGADRCAIPLVSLAAKLNQPAITRSFQVTDYPTMDPAITGFNIPQRFGDVRGAEAFRIASGRWKWSDRAVIGIDSVVTQDGTTVTVTGTDHANGEFTVDASFDAEGTRLFVTGRGADLDYPGELIAEVVQDLGAKIPAANIDLTALAELDEERPAKSGHDVRTGPVKDVLDAIARSAFIDYLVDRTQTLSARARRRDQGSYLADGEFETDSAGFVGEDGAVVAQTTARAFLSAGALSITKAAGDALAHARRGGLSLLNDTLYVVTLVAALLDGETEDARLALTDSDGNEYLSDPYTLRADRWTRMTLFTSVPIANAVIFCSSTTVPCSTTEYLCSARGGDLRIYPQYGGADDVQIVVDKVEVVEVVVLDDSNFELVRVTPNDEVLWRVRPRYGYDARVDRGQFGNAQDSDVRDPDTGAGLAPTAESRELPGFLVDEDDAALVATAALAYARSGQTTIAGRLLDPDVLVSVGGRKVVYLNTSRRPPLPDDGQLFRLIALDESRPEDGPPEIRLEAEARYDAVADPMVIPA